MLLVLGCQSEPTDPAGVPGTTSDNATTADPSVGSSFDPVSASAGISEGAGDGPGSDGGDDGITSSVGPGTGTGEDGAATAGSGLATAGSDGSAGTVGGDSATVGSEGIGDSGAAVDCMSLMDEASCTDADCEWFGDAMFGVCIGGFPGGTGGLPGGTGGFPGDTGGFPGGTGGFGDICEGFDMAICQQIPLCTWSEVTDTCEGA